MQEGEISDKSARSAFISGKGLGFREKKEKAALISERGLY